MKLDFELSELFRGYNVSIAVVSNINLTFTVTLIEGSSMLAEIKKTSTREDLHMVDQKYFDLQTGRPTLTINVPDAENLSQSRVAGLISDQRARRVGFSYNFCIETSNNDHMDDIYVNVVGWANKG